MKNPTVPISPPESPKRRGPPPGSGVAPVEIHAPTPGDATGIEEILRRALPGMQGSVAVIRNLPRWLQDDMADLPPSIREAMQEKLDGLTDHAARLEAGLRAVGACAQLVDHRPRNRRVDATPMIENIVRQRMIAAGRSFDMLVELPPVDTDAELLCGIVGGLCDAAISNARRVTDRIEIRAIHTGGTLRLSALYPGSPLVAGEGGSLFDGQPRTGSYEPAAALGLAYVWQAVARLDGRIEIGPGFRGVGARITAILPPKACAPDAD